MISSETTCHERWGQIEYFMSDVSMYKVLGIYYEIHPSHEIMTFFASIKAIYFRF